MIERRFSEVRAAGPRGLVGVVMRYRDIAIIPGLGRERFMPGAFDPIGDVILNRQHQRADPLARTGGGGLVLASDGDGCLQMAATLPETSAARDSIELVRAKVLRGLSVEFAPLADHYDGDLRTITRARLHGIGLVDSSAYPESIVEARELQFIGKSGVNVFYRYKS